MGKPCITSFAKLALALLFAVFTIFLPANPDKKVGALTFFCSAECFFNFYTSNLIFVLTFYFFVI